MEQKFYTVDEIASIIDLHPKTVRRFIREGKIKAVKIGRSWRISQEDFAEYAHMELKPGTEVEKDIHSAATAEKYAEPGNKNRVSVSAVIEIHEKEPEEASRISNSLMALLNSKDPGWGQTRYDFIYHPEVKKARFVLYGSPTFIAAIMQIFQVIIEQE